MMLQKRADYLLRKARADNIFLWTDENRIDENLFYLLGRAPDTSTAGLLVSRGKAALLVSELEIGNYKNIKSSGISVEKLTRDSLKSCLKKAKGRLGVNFEHMTLAQSMRMKRYTKAKLTDISGHLGAARSVKSQREIKKIKTACKITLEIFSQIPAIARKCRTEKELALWMESLARKNDVRPAFPVIAASGRGSATPHYETASRKIAPGFLIVDFGVVYDGYCSDLTRTFFVGSPTVYHKHKFAAVFSAKEAAAKAAKAGAHAKEVHAAAESVIMERTGQKLLHSAGHGIGMRVHDFPDGINSRSKFCLKENMCIAIEPGWYGKDGGVRIEDNVIVKRGRPVELTRAERELVVLRL